MFGRRKPNEDSIVDQIARRAGQAGLGQKPAQEQTPQPALPQTPAPQPMQAQPAKRPRKVFRATRTVFRGIGGIWRTVLTLADILIVVIIAGIVVLVLHGLVASGALHVPASIGKLIDFLYRLVTQISGVVARRLTK